MSLGTILLIILLLLVAGAFPGWSYSANWGHGPWSALSVIAVVVLILLLMGRL